MCTIYITKISPSKRTLAGFCSSLFLLLFLSATIRAAMPPGQLTLQLQSSLLFNENKGQWAPAVDYRADLPGGTVFLEKNGFTYVFINQDDIYGIHPPKKDIPAGGLIIRMHAVKVKFLGAETGTLLSAGNA